MTLKIADRVKETTKTTGTGTLNLAGAVSNFQGFVAAVGNTNQCNYAIVHQRNDEWEIAHGTVTDATPDTLSRDYVTASSNGGNPVDFSAGTKDVFLTLPAVAIPNHEVSVENFGATGDGTTDDSAAIQAAIDIMEANGGGTVRFIPGKTYALGAGLTIDSDNITLYGPGAQLLQKASVEAAVVLAVAGSDGSEISNIRIQGLDVDANYGNQTGGNTPRGIQVTFAYNVVLEQVTVHNAWVAIEFADGATYGTAGDCFAIGYYNDGFEVSGTNASDANKPQHITLRNPRTYSAQVDADNSIEIEDGAKDVSVIGGSSDKRVNVRNHDEDGTGTTSEIYVIGHTSPAIRVTGITGKEDNTIENIFIVAESSANLEVNAYVSNVTFLTETEFSVLDGSLLVAAGAYTFTGGTVSVKGDAGGGYGESFYVYDNDDSDSLRIRVRDTGMTYVTTTGSAKFATGGSCLFDADTFVSFISAAGQHQYFTAGGFFYFRDKDDGSVTRASIDSATGNMIVNGSLSVGAEVTLLEKSTDPAEPAEGACVIWMSDGTGKGDDGDILIASQAGGVTKWATLFDHSGGAGW